MENFNNLVERLKKEGYEVHVMSQNDYTFAVVQGYTIRGAFCTEGEGRVYTDINGKIAADHRTCFESYSKCPVKLPIPKNEKQMEFLLRELEFWGSEEGRKTSDELEYEQFITFYPKSIV